MPAYEMICAFLGTNWYAVAGTAGLAALIFVHIIYAIILTLQNRRARGGDKYASSNLTPADWSSKNMFVLGIVLAAFLLMHLYDFWFQMMFAELFHMEPIACILPDGPIFPEQVGGHMAKLFSSPVKVVLYLIGITALWFHLTHGMWSMFQSTGLNGRTWLPRVKCIGNIVATLICLGFALVPVFFLAKYLLCGA